MEEYIIETEWEKQENRAGSHIPLRRSSYIYTNTDPHVTTNESHPFNCTLHVPVVIIGSVVLSLFYYIFFTILFIFFAIDLHCSFAGVLQVSFKLGGELCGI